MKEFLRIKFDRNLIPGYRNTSFQIFQKKVFFLQKKSFFFKKKGLWGFSCLGPHEGKIERLISLQQMGDPKSGQYEMSPP